MSTKRAILVRIRAVVALLLISAGLAGCGLGNDAASALVIRNDSAQTLWIDEEPESAADERIRIEAGGQTLIPTFECATSPIEAEAQDGKTLVVLDEEWCPGQIWYVRGPDDDSLEKAR